MSFFRAASRKLVRSCVLPYDLHKLAASTLRTGRMPAINPPLNFHHAVARDISAVFKFCERDEHSDGVPSDTFERLRALVRSIDGGGKYDLVDISFGPFHGLPRLYNAPLECMVVDELRPEGLTPAHGTETLPIAYDSIALANYLSGHGYNGTFIDTKPDVLGHNAQDGTALYRSARLPPEPSWGNFTPFSSIFDVLPPTLRILSASPDHPEIYISPAHPSQRLRWNMLKHMSESSAVFRMLSSVFWLWLRSHGIDNYSWMTCAFLVMYYLQAQFRLPSPPTSDIRSPSQEFLSKANSGSNQELQHLNIPSVWSIADLPDNPGVLLCKFFSFWANSRHIPYNYVLDPIGGTYTPRKRKYRANGKDLDEVQIMKGLRTLSNKGVKDAYWDYNPLVLVDPFLPYHNLAHTVTKHALHLMFHRAHFAAYALKQGQPVTEIFGAEGRSLSDTYAWKEGVAWLPSSSSQSTSLPHPFQRTYYTTARAKRSKLPPPTIHPLPGVPRYVLANREKTIKRVERAIRKRYDNQYTVECFGSTQYGVDSPTSDLDLVILDHDRENGFSPDVSIRSLPVVYNVQNLARSLEYYGFRVIQTIPTASVPIVKFEDPRTNLNCDINVNDRLGLCNTRLIAQYCKLSPLLRPLLGLIKKWAKTTGLNDPSGDKGTATFSSYSLTLMTIGFLQAHEQLPNLQAGLPPLTAEDAFWLRGKDNVRTRCDPRFHQDLSWSPPEDAITFDLREVLCAWFRYWGHQYNYALDVMSIRDGGVIPRVDKAETTITADKQGKKRARVLARRSQRDRKRAEKEARAGRNTSPIAKETESFVDELTGERVGLELKSEDVVEEVGEGEETAAVEDLDDTALEEMTEVDLEQGKQPHSWALAALVVADPFILSKNATGAITVRAIERFAAECRRALLLLSAEADFEDLLGDGSAIGLRGGRGRRGGGKGKGRGRGGNAEWMTRGRQESRGRADQGEKEKRGTSRSSGGDRNRDGVGDGRRARSDSRGNNGGEKEPGEVRLKESGSSRGEGRGYGHGSGRGRGGERPVQSRGSGRGTEREDRNAGQEADSMRYNGPGRWATRSLAIRRGTGNANTRANPS